jgi:hypothetical protein
MGITIAYRGALADLTRIEDFEDRLLDLALEMGGQAQIWRSNADGNPERMVRGIVLNLAPGLESTSLLVSPEGWLVGLTDIEDAELGRLTEPPWCFTKTQFGPIEGHVALVEMLTVLRAEFLPDLEVSDEGGYWETRDLAELRRRHEFLGRAIEGMGEGLQSHGLTAEAAENHEIILRRIERIAARVHAVLRKPAEHPPVAFPDDELYGVTPDSAATEAAWDEMFKHNRRQQERLQRALEGRQSRGETDESAFENALGDLGIEIPGEGSEDENEPWRDDESVSPVDDANDEEDSPGGTFADEIDEQGDPLESDVERHPLLQRATDLMLQLHSAFRDRDKQWEPALRTLFQGAGDAAGGLAQALAREDDDREDYGLRLVQFKRALRGAAFARGALFSLRSAVPAERLEVLRHGYSKLQRDIFQELTRLRNDYREFD